jgi:hypothetical protein
MSEPVQNDESPKLIDMSALKSEPPTPPKERSPGLLVHLLVFVGTATAAFLGYSLIF